MFLALRARIAGMPSLTVFGRSLLLIFLGVAANTVCLAVAARLHSIIGLAILAWTIGLRHALDADHIRLFGRRLCALVSLVILFSIRLSAIDNATRTLICHGRLGITCGLYFSLGHSTIVIVVNVALVISTSIYNKLEGVGNVGSILGTAISGAFLFIIGLVNLVILCKILWQRRQARHKRDSEHTQRDPEPAPNENMLVMRLLGPLVNFVNRPWKMYPVGVLFGLGFDTASSIALLAISALAKGSRRNIQVHPSQVIILPVLFTTGMSLVDSLDSILMFYSYTGFADHSWRVFEPSTLPSRTETHGQVPSTEERRKEPSPGTPPQLVVEQFRDETENKRADDEEHNGGRDAARQERGDRTLLVKQSTMSRLSIILTTMSILLAFSMSLIEIMGLIEANCGKCAAAASAPDGGGLAGGWWRFWLEASDNYGYIGAGIVGMFVVVVCGWYIAKRSCKMFWRRG